MHHRGVAKMSFKEVWNGKCASYLVDACRAQQINHITEQNFSGLRSHLAKFKLNHIFFSTANDTPPLNKLFWAV